MNPKKYDPHVIKPEQIGQLSFQIFRDARRRMFYQVFEDPESRQELWFIEDAPGVITALLPDDR